MKALTNKEIVNILKTIELDIRRLHSGNVAHQREQIRTNLQWLIEALEEKGGFEDK